MGDTFISITVSLNGNLALTSATEVEFQNIRIRLGLSLVLHALLLSVYSPFFDRICEQLSLDGENTILYLYNNNVT